MRRDAQDSYRDRQIFPEADSPTVFPATNSPLANPTKSPEYREFLTELYRFDKDKDPQTFQVKPEFGQRTVRDIIHNNQYQHRVRREIIFRPFFVYQQQSVGKPVHWDKQNLNAIFQKPPVVYPYGYNNNYY